ncbi:hypothetical protein FACS1894176_06020 [Bacteroidia bacterium]|nr:hypothetical protein FACS1894176_06020 [Bacteroidia bacterium]
MKQINIVGIGLLLLVVVCYSCVPHKIDNRQLTLKNQSFDSIYCIQSYDDYYTDWYRGYKIENKNKYNIENEINETFLTEPNSVDYIHNTSWKLAESYSTGNKIRFFIIAKDSVNKYGWDTIVQNTIYSKKYEYNIHELDSIQWTIIYSGPAFDLTKNTMMDQFEEFRKKDKFGEDLSVFYPGMSDDLLKSELTNKINLVSDEFKQLSLQKGVTSKEYQDMIGKSMNTFSDIYFDLDSEDLDRICSYYEELMDIVGLESSGGHLNTFRYGFNPLLSITY